MKKGKEKLREKVRSHLCCLPPLEQQVLSLSLGLVDGKERDYWQIGTVVGLRRDRVGQIHRKALRTIDEMKASESDE